MIRTSTFALVVAFAIAGCGTNSTPAQGSSGDNSSNAPKSKLTALEVKDVKEGTGKGAKNGDRLSVVYTGKLANGTVFDSNDKKDANPFNLVLGAGSVIKGWDQGLVGVKEGGERTIAIPSRLGYGASNQEKIPANSDLYFDVKVLSIMRPEDQGKVKVEDLKVGTGPELKPGDAATIDYTGYVGTNFQGKEIDSKDGFAFTVGANPPQVLPAIDQAVVGMKKGGEIKVLLPPGLGPMNPLITPGSMTTYDITLKSIKQGKGK